MLFVCLGFCGNKRFFSSIGSLIKYFNLKMGQYATLIIDNDMNVSLRMRETRRMKW